MMQDALAVAPPAPSDPAATSEDEDWLTMPEADLEAMHAESLTLFRGSSTAALAGRAAASLALLHQLVLARGAVRALGLPPDKARDAMRSDHALGYFFGLAIGDDPSAPRRPEREVAGILVMLHDLVFGRRRAEQLTEALLGGGTLAVGDAFGAGMLAATEDLAALNRWRYGKGGALPCRLLDGLALPGWSRERGGDRQH